MKNRSLLIICLFLVSAFSHAQTRLKPYEEYIETYKSIALENQKRFGIPASITLAQGLLESGAGKSELAIKSNNHFGIKCHNNWKGETVQHFDDGVMSCFRKYNRASESFEDHSLFLVNGARYRALFQIPVNNYAAWAKGLQKAGYATDRQYADKLIRVIETYELQDVTRRSGSNVKARRSSLSWKERRELARAERAEKRAAKEASRLTTTQTNDVLEQAKDYHSLKTKDSGHSIQPQSTHEIFYLGTTPYIVVQFGDSFKAIADEFGIRTSRVYSLNDFPSDYTLTQGEVVYLDKKSNWWEGENPIHTAKAGETLLMIAQTYGLKLKALYKMNQLTEGMEIQAGQRIKLRNPEQMSNFVRTINENMNQLEQTPNQ